jgi:hypothetical protein
MQRPSLILVALALAAPACGKRIPLAADIAPGTPYVSWIIMHGDRDNPDREFACQSDARAGCVVPASSADGQVFSHVYFYYHGAGGETKYAGSVQIGFFQGAAESHDMKTNITVKKNESITNQSVTGIVTNNAGTYALTLALEATTGTSATSQPVRDTVNVIVK